ncbi:MAG: magnesium chelatase subunit D [Pseudomonadota bacterium]
MASVAAHPSGEEEGGAREPADSGKEQWRNAYVVAGLLAVDPIGLGGVCIRSGPGPVRDWWTDQFFALLPAPAPRRKLPIGASEERLLGGLDLSMTLSTGQPVAERGLLADADGGAIIAAMAERMTPATAANIAAAMDQGSVIIERNGVSRRDETRFACVLFDEGVAASERPPQLLLDRIAFHIDLDNVSIRDVAAGDFDAAIVSKARESLSSIETPAEIAKAINAASLSLGVVSMRALLFCLSAARAAAAIQGRDAVTDADAELACRLVLAPRFSPPLMMEPDQSAPTPEQQNDTGDDKESKEESLETDEIEDMIVNAVRGAAMTSLLGKSSRSVRRNASVGSGGKSGAPVESKLKGRPLGSRKGNVRDGGRLDVIATLRTAAPWQKLRSQSAFAGGDRQGRLSVYPEDISIKRFKGRTESVVIFVVDASGSSAMHRMAEAKGAVELLLADCYTRRDHVALIAFRGQGADLLLPPTRSLARVRRALGALPGGGGTPLAAGLAAAATLAETEKRKGKTPYVVILSDGRGNIGLNGEPGRAAAEEDATMTARRLRETNCTILFFDISNRPSSRAQRLSNELRAFYQPLPYADSAAVSKTVKAAISAA